MQGWEECSCVTFTLVIVCWINNGYRFLLFGALVILLHCAWVKQNGVLTSDGSLWELPWYRQRTTSDTPTVKNFTRFPLCPLFCLWASLMLISLDLLLTRLVLMHSRLASVFLAIRAHCWPPGPLGSSIQSSPFHFSSALAYRLLHKVAWKFSELIFQINWRQWCFPSYFQFLLVICAALPRVFWYKALKPTAIFLLDFQLSTFH